MISFLHGKLVAALPTQVTVDVHGVGYGAAQKLAVAKMVQRMLQLADLPDPDAADALALALTHVQSASRFSLAAPKRV